MISNLQEGKRMIHNNKSHVKSIFFNLIKMFAKIMRNQANLVNNLIAKG